jgi:hypothetical protein
MRSLRPPPAAAPWPKLMLISCAASGVAETISAATEAATVLKRTRRPHGARVRSLVDGLTNSPSPVRGYRRAWSCPGSAWLRGAEAVFRSLTRLGGEGAAAAVRHLTAASAPASAPGAAAWRAAGRLPWDLTCATPLRGAVPYRPGFDRQRSLPPRQRASRWEPKAQRRLAPVGRYAARAEILRAGRGVARKPPPWELPAVVPRALLRAARHAVLDAILVAVRPDAVAPHWGRGCAGQPDVSKVHRQARQACHVAGAAAFRAGTAATATRPARAQAVAMGGNRQPVPAKAAICSIRFPAAEWRAAARRDRQSPASPARRGGPRPRVRYWVRRRRRSVRRSSKGVRHCRA